jgi:hypothetical protein
MTNGAAAYYPEMPCHLAPLRPDIAPFRFCRCRPCGWARALARYDASLDVGPVRPGSERWEALLEIAGAQIVTRAPLADAA